MKTIWSLFLLGFLFSCSQNKEVKVLPDLSPYNLEFDYLPTTWDEGLPLGNGQIGALIWQKEDKLRLSLDHVDLWDERKMENLQGEPYKYSWVKEQWENDNYKEVQDLFDAPYNKAPAPSKIPGGGFGICNFKFWGGKKEWRFHSNGYMHDRMGVWSYHAVFCSCSKSHRLVQV
jgi:alpha-L-fucosidase 2